jgi:hypothetical protein
MKKGTKICCNKYFTILNLKDVDFDFWEGNRKTDRKRVDHLKKIYLDNKWTFIPGIIHLFKKIEKNTEQYFIYDGAHRYQAAKEYAKEHQKNMKMLVYILDDISNMKEDFKEINDIVPVPDIYFTSSSETKKNYEQAVDHIIKNYKEFQSKSNKPMKPNFNQHIFLEQLSNVVPNNMESSTIIKNLIKLNNKLRKKYSNTTEPNNQLLKCKKHDFYIFYEPKWSDMLSEIINDLTDNEELLVF